MDEIHYYETTVERRKRLDSRTCHGQALCGNASVRDVTRISSDVTCEACLKKLRSKK